jgi:hypothetical protein
MRCSSLASQVFKYSVPAAALFVCSGPAFAHSHSHHHAYRHHAHYSSRHVMPMQANGFAAPGYAAPGYAGSGFAGSGFAGSGFVGSGGWNSGTYASPYAQNSFGQTRAARRPLYNVSAMPSGEAGASGLPPSLIQRVIARESGGNPRAVHAGNYGLMQIRLGTARAMGYTGSAAGLLDPQTNMTYGLRYLAGAYRAAGGNESRAIALYQRGYYYQAKAQGFSPYSSGAASSGFGNYGATFQPGYQTNAWSAGWPAEQYGVRHRRHYRA